MEEFLGWANFVVLIGGGLWLKSYLHSYLSKKAENLATREDIAAITDQVEGVRHDYSARLEALRAEAGSQLHVHSVRYSNEYEILTDLAARLVDLRDAASGLRPVFDMVPEDEPESDRKRERLARFQEAHQALYELSEKRQPFYPKELFDQVGSLSQVCRQEAVQFSLGDPAEFDRYWAAATKNAEDIQGRASLALDAIRTRAEVWEKFGARPEGADVEV